MTHTAISYTDGRICQSKAALTTEAQIGQKKNYLHSRKRVFSTHFFRLVFRLGDLVEKLDFFDWTCGSASRKLNRKSFTPAFFKTHRIAHPTTKHTPTRPHTHARYHTAVSYNSADAALAITAVDSRRMSAWRTPSSARQQRVPHNSSSARCRCHFANNGYACCSLGSSRLSVTPRT